MQIQIIVIPKQVTCNIEVKGKVTASLMANKNVSQ